MRQLIDRFDEYVIAFDRKPAFTRFGQKEYHVATIALRNELGSAAAALDSDRFLNLVRQTVASWGIGGRGSVLADPEAFCTALRARAPQIVALDGVRIGTTLTASADLAAGLWELIASLDIVNNDAKLVSSTKVLHHLLPDLVVPMDRKFTRAFFAWHVPEFQYQQQRIFTHAFAYFSKIARATNVTTHATGVGWRTSRAKIIDNALVGFCTQERVPTPS